MADIYLYGIIGDPDDLLEAATVCQSIRNANGNLTVHINSPGGMVMEGLPIYEALRNYSGGSVTVVVDGLAASMASIIAMAATTIVMAENAMMMIHRPWDCSIGDADALRADAAMLDKIEAQMVKIYAARTGLDPAKIATMLAAETWMDATEAVAFRFADRINAALPLAAMADLSACGFRRPPVSSVKGNIPMPDNRTGPGGAAPGAQPLVSGTPSSVMQERERVTQISALCARHNLSSDLAMSLIDRGAPLAEARETILEALAQRSEASAGIGFPGGAATFDNPNFLGKALADAMYAKMAGKPADGPAAEFRGMSLVDMAAELVERTGRGNVRRMKPHDILNAAAWLGNGPRSMGGRDAGWGGGSYGNAAIVTTTGDFPDLLEGVGQRYLLDQYQVATSPLKQIGRVREAKDFRPINALQLSEFGTLPVLGEGGEIAQGTFSERKETYSLQTFAKQFTLTRQAIINDDLHAFSDPLTIMGRAAASTEADVLAALLNNNPAMSDGNALFSSAHGNINTTPLFPGTQAVSTARQAMRNQTDMDGVTFINAAPKFVLSGPGYETAIEQLVTIPINATEVDQTNPFVGKLTPLVDPRLSGNFWYMFADPGYVPTIEYANLNGNSGPTCQMQNGWDVLGVAFRVYEDFGAGIVDYRGAWRQTGG